MVGWIQLESLTFTSIGVRLEKGYSDKLCLLFGLSNNAPYTYCSCLITAQSTCTSSSISSVSRTAKTIGCRPRNTIVSSNSMLHLSSIVRHILAALTCSVRCGCQTLSQPNRLCLGPLALTCTSLFHYISNALWIL